MRRSHDAEGSQILLKPMGSTEESGDNLMSSILRAAEDDGSDDL